jgi:hypothetical protein
MLEQRGLLSNLKTKRGKSRSNSKSIPSNIGQYELEVQFLAKFSDSAFGG